MTALSPLTRLRGAFTAALAVAVCALPFAMAPSVARAADCVAACMKTQGCTDASPTSEAKRGGNCASMKAFCEGQCQPAGSGSRYGVIAYSPKTGALGTADGFTTESGAAAAALARCRMYAPDCEALVHYANSCVAVAVGKNGSLAWDADPTSRGRAETNARQDCARKGGVACRTAASDCSLR